ncbi:MAG: hypothetical protein AAGD35_06640 [Actinomycetota bacterium]
MGGEGDRWSTASRPAERVAVQALSLSERSARSSRGGVRPLLVGVGIGAITVLVGTSLGGPVLAAVGGAGLVGGAALGTRRFLHGRGWRPPVVTMPETVALGERFEVVYRRASVRPVDVSTAPFTAHLSCTEWVAEQTGSTRSVTTELVVERSVNGEAIGTPQGYEARCQLTIPVEVGGPTLSLRHHRIDWTVRFDVGAEQVPDDTARYPVVVWPELDPSLAVEGDR